MELSTFRLRLREQQLHDAEDVNVPESDNVFLKNHWCDTAIYAMLDREYRASSTHLAPRGISREP